jgi:hypothetical protein
MSSATISVSRGGVGKTIEIRFSTECSLYDSSSKIVLLNLNISGNKKNVT